MLMVSGRAAIAIGKAASSASAEQRSQDGVRPAVAPRPFPRHELRHQYGLPVERRNRRLGRAPFGREAALGQGLQHPSVLFGGGDRPLGREHAGYPVRAIPPCHPVHPDIQLGNLCHFDAVDLDKVTGQPGKIPLRVIVRVVKEPIPLAGKTPPSRHTGNCSPECPAEGQRWSHGGAVALRN